MTFGYLHTTGSSPKTMLGQMHCHLHENLAQDNLHRLHEILAQDYARTNSKYLENEKFKKMCKGCASLVQLESYFFTIELSIKSYRVFRELSPHDPHPRQCSDKCTVISTRTLPKTICTVSTRSLPKTMLGQTQNIWKMKNSKKCAKVVRAWFNLNHIFLQ